MRPPGRSRRRRTDVSISSGETSISSIPVQPDVMTSWAWYSSADRPTAPAFTRSGMSLLTNVTRLPSAARLAAQVRIRESLRLGPEARGQHRRVAVVQLDMQRAALRPNGNRLIQPSVLEPQIVEHPQCLPGEPAQLMMMPLGFQFADDHQRDHDFVLGKPRGRPRIGQQHGGVEHIGPDGRISHVALLEPARPRTNLSADTAVPGPGPVLS